MVKGTVHSIETMGLVDGPGIRVVVFLQGCALRCAYCHNPDTWQIGSGRETTPEELISMVKRYKGFFKSSGGGVTLSGGEPLLQPQFVEEFFKLCREEGIHTALDTAGYGLGSYDGILKYTDLVILDIKHIDEGAHRELTGHGRNRFLQFLDAVKRNETKLWIRHVVVPGITDGEEHIRSLGELINTIQNVENIELLPYHTYGVNKYNEMGLSYKLEGTPPLSEDRLARLYDVLENTLDIKLRHDANEEGRAAV